MKLRRALVALATTAAVAPAALTMATVAYADDGSPSAAPTTSAGAAASDAPVDAASGAPTDASSAAATAGDTASATASVSASGGAPAAAGSASAVPSAAPTPTAEPTDLGFCEEQNPRYKATLRIALSGLPGKIAKGSGWHPFKMTVTNPSKDAIKDITLAAGVGPQNGDNPFTLKQVALQAYDPDARQWFNVTDDGTHSLGSLGPGDLPGRTAVDLSFRLNVTPKAPVGKALTIGLGVYPDTKNNCVATGFAAYKIDIVKPGTRTTGSNPVPQTGGEAPLPSKAPAKSGTSHVVPVSDTNAAGSLAHTGTSSALPLIAGIGGAAVVVGAGAVFAVRRRKSGGAAA